MALVYESRASTRDVDATYRPVEEVEAAGAAVGERHGYPSGWINDDVAQFSPPGGELERSRHCAVNRARSTQWGGSHRGEPKGYFSHSKRKAAS